MYLLTCSNYFSLFTATLLIRDADEPDSGTYECIAENSVGSETSNRSELVVRGKKNSSFEENSPTYVYTQISALLNKYKKPFPPK